MADPLLPDNFNIDAVESWAQGCGLATDKPFLQRAAALFITTLESAEQLRTQLAEAQGHFVRLHEMVEAQNQKLADAQQQVLKTECLLRLSEVRKRVPYSRTHLYRLMASGEFPKPISMGVQAIAWPESVIDEWIAARVTAGVPPKQSPSHKLRRQTR